MNQKLLAMEQKWLFYGKEWLNYTVCVSTEQCLWHDNVNGAQEEYKFHSALQIWSLNMTLKLSGVLLLLLHKLQTY